MLKQYRYKLGQFPVAFQSFRLTGSDVRSFLQAQSTFNIEQLPVGRFHLNTFLDPQGRVEVYGWMAQVENSFIYLVPELLREQAIERLHRFLISEDVTITEPVSETWWIALGPEATEVAGISGEMFGEEARLLSAPLPKVPQLSSEEIELWTALTGWPAFDGSGFEKELINNLRLFDLALSLNKGCYPGQETVLKINTRRGAAYAPVLLEVAQELPAGDITNFGKRIGKVSKCYAWEGKLYQVASVLRDFRVEGMKIEGVGTVRYFPLISGSKLEKAQELFYAGTDSFRNDDNTKAEELLRLALKFDPGFADAYEALGVMLGREERFNEAIELMQKLLEVDPASVMAHTNMSLYLMRLGRIEEAEEHKSHATVKSFQKFGEEARVKEELEKRKQLQAEEWQKRESMFLQVLDIDAEDTLANYGLGSIAVERGEWEKARTHLEKVLAADPKYSVAYLALGRAYLGLGLKAEAEKIWREGISVAANKGDLMPANQMQAELEHLV